MTKPLVIFDFDGVLVDSAAFLRRSLYDNLTKLGYRFLRAPSGVAELFRENIADALIGHGVTPDHLCALWESVQREEREAEVPLCAGIPEMLAAVAKLATLAVVSSNGTEMIREILGKHGVLARFASISGVDDDMEMAKVQRIAECVRASGADAEKAIYIGDSQGDIGEAREAGVTAVAASWGLHSVEMLAEASPDCIVREPSEIVDLVQALAGAGIS